jgi:uncharacterized protein
MRQIDETVIEHITLGASLLGTGGGGDPYIGKLMALSAVKKHGPVTMISPVDVPDEALVVPSAMMGAPIVAVEKIPNGKEFLRSFKGLEKTLGRKIYATLPIEAGGINSMIPIAVAAQTGLPIVDADGMGRAFPEIQMVTFHLYEVPACPMVLMDEKGNTVLLETINNNTAESIARAVTVVMGGSAMMSNYSMTGRQLKKFGIPHILSFSEKIGKILSKGTQKGINPIDEILAITKGYQLFKGKIIDVERKLEGGFNKGLAKIEGIEKYKGKSLAVDFQNENLIARMKDQVLAMTPDLICIVDLDTTIPVTTESLKYGRRVLVFGMPCDERWRTPKGIETVGPRYFGYDLDYVQIENLATGVN